MSPLLSVAQFTRFMNVIKILGNRVEAEHLSALKEIKRIEEAGSRSDVSNNGNGNVNGSDFERLVRGPAHPDNMKATSQEISWDSSPTDCRVSSRILLPRV